MRGVAASFRLKHLFMCKSTVINVESTLIEYFYPMLKPWLHYVPVASDLSDLVQVIEFLRANDEVAREIADEGFRIISQNLTMGSVKRYWLNLLTAYQKLLTFKPVRDATLMRIT